MLCQLVCLDRRYQRMNCFNVRELQILLRGRFFADLVNDTAHHDFLNNTMIGLRFKTNDLNSITPNTLLTYQYGLSNTTFTQTSSYNPVTSGTVTEGVYNFLAPKSTTYNLVSLFSSNPGSNSTNLNTGVNLTGSVPTDLLGTVVKFFSNVRLY